MRLSGWSRLSECQRQVRRLAGLGALSMGFRFGKSVRLFPGFRLNLSTRGVSASVGSSPLTVKFSKQGVRSTTSIPGTGISFVMDHSAQQCGSNPHPPATKGEGGDAPIVSWRTRKLLDQHLVLEIKDVHPEADGFRYRFDFHCTDCGGSELEVPDSPDERPIAYCRACGFRFGLMAEVRAYAEDKAAAHLAEAKSLETAKRKRAVFRGIIVAITIGAFSWWWLKSHERTVFTPNGAVQLTEQVGASASSSQPGAAKPAEVKPGLTKSISPPPRPKSLSAGP